jgi:hypothetical protein
MYYRLDTEFHFPACLVNIEDNVHETLMSGTIVDETELTLPWPFSMECDNDPDMHLGDYYSSYNLMSDRFIEVLRECGVDNLQIFPASITHTCTGKRIDNYKVVNVLGMVSAADMGASTSRPFADGVYFEKLAVDSAKTRGLLIFRLEESSMEILVHASVAEKIRSAKLVDISLEEAPAS